jgi:hypothetical protein
MDPSCQPTSSFMFWLALVFTCVGTCVIILGLYSWWDAKRHHTSPLLAWSIGVLGILIIATSLFMSWDAKRNQARACTPPPDTLSQPFSAL